MKDNLPTQDINDLKQPTIKYIHVIMFFKS